VECVSTLQLVLGEGGRGGGGNAYAPEQSDHFERLGAPKGRIGGDRVDGDRAEKVHGEPPPEVGGGHNGSIHDDAARVPFADDARVEILEYVAEEDGVDGNV
jgi:hypothetical protein